MSGPNELPLIRLAEKDDCAEILRLIQELADYEKMSDGPKIGADVLERDGFGATPRFKCFVSEDGSEAITDSGRKRLTGYALYFYTYSTWEGLSVYMEDLYVTPDQRKKGIGKRLWKAVVKAALEDGCTRCNFSVLDWNKPSIEFYKSLGAVDLTGKEGWLAFRMNKEVMQEFVKS